MALPTFSQASAATTNTTGVTAHTISSASVSAVTNGIGLLWVEKTNNNTDNVTGATWGGVSMTPIVVGGVSNTTDNRRLYGFYVLAPTTGTVNMVATTAAAENCRLWWATIQNAAQKAPEATNAAFVASTSVMTPSVTVVSDESLVIGGGIVLGNIATPTVDSGTTSRMNDTNSWFTWTEDAISAGALTSGYTGLTAASRPSSIIAAFATSSPKNDGFFFMM